MGTSLSGLTPATTFDGLLKVGDNDPLTAELKAISTGDGTDTILQLSTTALQISGDTTIETTGTWVNGFNSNLRLESDAPSMQFKDTGGTPGFMIGVSGGSTIFYQSSSADFSSTNAVGRIFSGRWSFGVGTDLGASVGIKGSGASALTTSLLVQNSDGTELLNVQDDGIINSQYLRLNGASPSPLISAEGNAGKAVRLGNEGYFSSFNYLELKTWDGTSYSPVIRVTGNTTQNVGIGETTPTARLHVKGSGTTSATTSLLVQNSAGTSAFEVKDNLDTHAYGGLYSSIIRVNYINTYNNGYSVMRTHLGDGNASFFQSVAVGQTTTPTARLQIKGSGTTSATTALLVQDSAGTDLLKVQDDKVVTFSGNTSALRLYSSLGFFHSGNSNNRLSADSTTGWVFATANATGNIQVKNTNVTASKETTAALQVDSTTQGFLPPRMTDAERDAIATPAAGLMIYDTTNNQMNYWNGSTWIAF